MKDPKFLSNVPQKFQGLNNYDEKAQKTLEKEYLNCFSVLFEDSPLAISINSAEDNSFIEVSNTFLELMGYSKEEVIGKTIQELDLFVNPEKLEIVLERDLSKGKVKNKEMQVKSKDGNILIGLFSIERIDGFGEESNLIIMVDITEKRNQGLDLERFFSLSLDLFCIVDLDGNFIKINKAWKKTLGYSASELLGSKFLDLIHEDDINETLKVFDKLAKDKLLTNFINRYRAKDGKYHYIEWRANVFEDKTYSSGRDMTERIKYEEKLLEVSNKDPLTNIYNRRYVYSRAEKLIEEYKRTGKVFSICIIDIDYFKRINDDYGHQAGDYILKSFTKVISKNLRSYDILGRYGGEEFIIILKNADKKQSNLIMQRILNIIRERTFNFKSNKINFTFSGGISTSTEIEKEELTIDKLFAIADKRMYRAKNEGRNKIVF